LRNCGALIPAIHYAPDEPDMRAFKKLREGEDLSENQQRKAMMVGDIFGRVWEHFEKLNPEHLPTILFAPGVPESIWFAEQFTQKGVPAAHIDGQDVWVDGKLERSSRVAREKILEKSKNGEIKVLCNRFVLREGIDAPWLAHGILATVFGSLQSYLQSGGRLLRAHPSLDHVTIQDHGGNYWRHGSLNEDRHWSLDYTPGMIYGIRAERIRNKKKDEPFRCPRCSRVWTVGTRCQPVHGGCGYELGNNKRSRPVVSTDGSLKEMSGSAFSPRRISQKPDGPKLWERMYWRSQTDKGERTFAQAMALYACENNWRWPDPRWPLMPKEEIDRYRLVRDVPRDRLIS
jgi:superfamily II DNA or RNA helicase